MQNVKVVAVSEPTIWTDAPGGPQKLTVDEFIAYVARVSNPSNQNNHLTATKLLKYLAKHKHWSPFEMVDVCMEISTTRDIGRQILRHRSFRFQEFSQRYADPTQDMGFVTREARLQDTKNRQNSIETDDESLSEMWEEMQRHLTTKSKETYQWAIENGIAKEQARAVLPEGLILSRMYMAGSLRSWIHYCQVRMDPSTQKEHREIAQMAWTNILFYFPSLSEVIIDS
jgi:thymidylate synthase (FAD)